MEKLKEKSWKNIFLDNYNGKSTEAKEVADFVKENYKGNNYIPWATMERLTYMQDENAEFKTIETENGSIVWTDTCENINEVIADGTIKQGSKSVMFSHFVKVSLTFMGKTFIEEYPIQDQDYSALKIYNQNAVNKALKRALAKVASRATGIGLRLYENKDLQFEEDKEDKKPVINKKETTKSTKVVEPKKEVVEPKKEVEKVVELPTNQTGNEVTQPVEEPIIVEEVKKVEEPIVVEEVKEGKKTEKVEKVTTMDYSNDILELLNLIRGANQTKMAVIIQNLNVPILKQHGFTLNLDDSDEEFCEKLTHFQDVTVFTRAITNMLG